MSKIGSTRISKEEFYRGGGFSNPNYWRKMVGGSWQYYTREYHN